MTVKNQGCSIAVYTANEPSKFKFMKRLITLILLLLQPALFYVKAGQEVNKKQLFNALANSDTAEVRFKTYTYKKIGAQNLQLDAFMPSSNNIKKQKKAVLILFHGGGWTGGKREQMYPQCQYFAKRGLVTVTASYRFVNPASNGPDSTKEVCIQDAKSAVRWVKLNAEKLGVDSARIILGGGSAGGHLATMAAMNPEINDPADDVSVPTHADALVLFNPGYAVNDDPPELLPYNFISEKTPPVIMFFGDMDKWKVPVDRFLNKLKAHGVKTEMWIAAGQKHGFFNEDKWVPATCAKADSFLVSLGLLKGKLRPISTDAQLILEK